MARRQPWENLSTGYRERLQRKGITRESFEAGSPIAKARGKGSEREENDRKQVDRFVAQFEKHYSFVQEDVKDWLRSLPPAERKDYMASQREAQRLYLKGKRGQAADTWHAFIERHQDIPEWANKYHAYFS